MILSATRAGVVRRRGWFVSRAVALSRPSLRWPRPLSHLTPPIEMEILAKTSYSTTAESKPLVEGELSGLEATGRLSPAAPGRCGHRFGLLGPSRVACLPLLG